MPKNLIICCDGTNNQFSGDLTNVVRLYEMAAELPGKQICYYDPGVGTMPATGLRTTATKNLSVLWGLAGGGGFLDNVTDAYRFLMSAYEDGDQIFLFGFSRGAYTVRALAGMIYKVGLLYRNTENLIDYAQKYWRSAYPPGGPGDRNCAVFKDRVSRDCPIHFMGLWDTVSSVGFYNQFRTFPYARHNPIVATVRHAVSIDERRCCFRKNLFEKSRHHPLQDVQNVWFAGVHSDVGGGYPAAETGLSKITLRWITDEAAKAGLKVTPSVYVELLETAPKPDALGTIHESLQGCWWLAEILPARLWSHEDRKYHWRWPLGGPRLIPEGAVVHPSVLERMADPSAKYRPKNLPEKMVAWPAADRD